MAKIALREIIILKLKAVGRAIDGRLLPLYVLSLSALWLYGVGWYIFSSDHDFLWTLPLLVLLFGIAGIGSYIQSNYLFHTHFWKVIFAVYVGIDLSLPFTEKILFLALFSPVIYALFQLSFQDKKHRISCVHAYWQLGRPYPRDDESFEEINKQYRKLLPKYQPIHAA